MAARCQVSSPRSIIPAYGWQSLFFIGGVAPIVIAIAAWLWLPELLKHLVVKEENRAKAAAIIAAMDPSRVVGAQTRFVIGDEKVYAKFRPAQLFQDGMQWITPLLWLCFVCNLMSFYFMNQFLPTVLAQAHIPMSDALLSTSVFQIGGTLGGLALSRPIDKMGLMPVCLLFVLSLCVAPFTGFATGVSETVLMIVIFFCGFTLLGLQFGLNATSAMIYPTSIRSNGSGWAFAVGRCGAVAGPYVAGVLIDMHLAVQQLYLALIVPLGHRHDRELRPGAALLRALCRHGAGPARDARRRRARLDPQVRPGAIRPEGGAAPGAKP